MNDYFLSVSNTFLGFSPANETSGTVNDGVLKWQRLAIDHPSDNDRSLDIATAALAHALSFISLADFDENHDGFVDDQELAIVIIAAGYEGATTTLTPSMWGHKYTYLESYAQGGVLLTNPDGRHHTYVIVGEVHERNGVETPVNQGIVAHELGHSVLGINDLYDHEVRSSNGIGLTCLMASGNWGQAVGDPNGGDTPVYINGYHRWMLGWIPAMSKPNHQGVVRLEPAAKAGANIEKQIYLGVTHRKKQFFVMENRQLFGYDRGAARWHCSGGGCDIGGVVLYHINEKHGSNVRPSERLIDVESPSGDDSLDARIWWRTDEAGLSYVFNDGTTPSARFAGGVGSNFAMRVLTPLQHNMRIKVSPAEAPEIIAPVDWTDDHAPVLEWRPSTGASSYLITMRQNGVTHNWEISRSQAGCGPNRCAYQTPVTFAPDYPVFFQIAGKNGVGLSESAIATFRITRSVDPPSGDVITIFPRTQNSQGQQDVTSQTNITFSWYAIPEASDYRLMIRKASGFFAETWVHALTWCENGGTSASDRCDFTWPNGPLPCGETGWWLMPTNQAGVENFGLGELFHVSCVDPPPAPQLDYPNSPDDLVPEVGAEFSWSPASNATRYHVVVADPSGPRVVESFSASEVGCQHSHQTCRLDLSTLAEPVTLVGAIDRNGTTDWASFEVAAENDLGRSAYAITAFLIDSGATPSVVSMIGPSRTEVSRPTLEWQRSANAARYVVALLNEAGALVQTWEKHSTDVSCPFEGDTCYLQTHAALENHKNYTIQVQALNQFWASTPTIGLMYTDY